MATKQLSIFESAEKTRKTRNPNRYRGKFATPKEAQIKPLQARIKYLEYKVEVAENILAKYPELKSQLRMFKKL